MRVLIADDDRVSAMMLQRTLESWGYEVVVTRDGIQAWEQISGEHPPQLAIVDWMMPGIDGLEICRRVRSTPPATPVYVILLTARTSRQDLVAGLDAGADDYLTKPFEPEELRARARVGERTLGLLNSIQRLTGLLPICSYCRRVRDDQDYWEQVESYVAKRSDARFSHGICPSCFTSVMAEEFPPAPGGAGPG